MITEKIGNITVIMGKNNSRVPFSTSLVIESKEADVLIDCGGGAEVFQHLKKEFQIRSLYLTHYHLDHVFGAYLFKDEATIHINPYDYLKLNDPFELAKSSGMAGTRDKNELEKWINKFIKKNKPLNPDRPLWEPIIGIADCTYPYEKTINLSGTNMIMLHTPGHTEGFCCPYFPEQGVLFAGDYDLTSFGPWYNNADSDIDEFIQSSKRTLETDAKYFVTSHHKGWRSRDEYEKGLTAYIEKIYEREEKVRLSIQNGVSPEEIVHKGIFYFVENHLKNPNLMISEIVGIAKHIQRLIKQGYQYEDYSIEFMSHFNLTQEAIEYRSLPYYVTG
ncbi:MBL fold metallo-hydrolase [Heyndrickxia acidicola]|uniref:MBL fold metallo-hydrolase n=1 Tax=Heyndrickxia acidicola TaxID=209389 RepID=A0ABU6MH81_9BACI|nr:MBL fold metallo-hydrolase [Heyndrickxia acidicola]MED1204034.1 MBL fold metallo-hydrolase [Heyndrickxia acidicola]